ncbi:MAG: HlyD family efflux transporter periplasmic adaptor subunit [Gemmatimonadota bacterium]
MVATRDGASTRPAEQPAETGRPPAGRARRMGRLRRRIGWSVVAAAVTVLVLWSLWPESVDVDTGTVSRGPLETTVDVDGVTRVQDRYEIATSVSGLLERTALRPGDTVVAGTVVARITPVPLDPQAQAQGDAHLAGALAREAEARSWVTQTQRALEQTERSTARMRVIAIAGAVSRDELERTELQLAAARSEHEAALARAAALNAEVGAARAALLGGTGSGGAVVLVQSPVTGTVLRIHQQSERVVPAGTPLVAIGDAAHLEVVVDVLSTDAVGIEPGAVMRLVDWGGSGELEARVRSVAPQGFTKVSTLGVEEQRVEVIGELPGAPPALGDAYRMEARIVTWSAPNVLKVANSALFRTGDAWSVLVVESGRARLRQVTVGHRGETETEILSGVESGETLIRFPSDRIMPGTRVRPRP